jgi:hypothetical protein
MNAPTPNLKADKSDLGEFTLRELLQKYFDKYQPYDGEDEQTLEYIQKMIDRAYAQGKRDGEIQGAAKMKKDIIEEFRRS